MQKDDQNNLRRHFSVKSLLVLLKAKDFVTHNLSPMAAIGYETKCLSSTAWAANRTHTPKLLEFSDGANCLAITFASFPRRAADAVMDAK